MKPKLFLLIAALLVAAFSMAEPRKEVNIWVSRNVAPSNKIRLNINTRNVPVVHVAAYRIDGAKWLRRIDKEQPRPGFTGKAVKEWDQTVAKPGDVRAPEQTDRYYSRQVNLPLLKPGVYLISVAGAPKEAWAVVNVTHLAVVAKRSPKRMLVWVTDALKGGVLPGATVTAYRRNGTVATTATTGRDGVALFDIKPGDETIVVSRGADMAGVPTAADDPDGVLRAHFQTDRPIYRPGQTVFFKAILRRTLGQGYRVVANEACTLLVKDPKDNPVEQMKLTSNAMGSVAGQFEIPSEGMVGPYTLELTVGKDVADQTFTVAEYRKPEYKVTVRPLQKRWLAGQDIQFEISADYYFGAPVQQASVRYSVRRTPIYFWGSDPNDRYFYGGDGNLYANDTYGGDPFVAEDTAYTAKDGKVVVTIHTDKNLPDSNYVLSCTVEDSSRRQVQGGSSVPVYSAGVRLGIRTSLVYASLGSVIPLEVRATDLDGKPARAKVTLILTTPQWVEKEGRYKEKELTRTTVSVPATGRATATVPALAEGELTIKAVADDGTGRKAQASMSTYVVGRNEKSVKENEAPSIRLMLDRRAYSPGDAVKAYVTTNEPGWPILLMAEGAEIWDYRVIEKPKRGEPWQLTTSVKMSPNAYVTAVQWFKGQMLSANQIVPLPDPARALTVKATPDKSVYHPGDKATYTIQTLDSKGNPVSAEVSLAVVDEAIYALSPDVTADLYGMYWGLRPNDVATFESAPEELSGGAYQRVSTVAPVRQRFEDTAYWGAFVQTGADGNATVSFEMPGNLTSWRATARGITTSTAVGTTTATVVANRAVMLRLATPRQMVEGDRVTLIGTIDNRSDQDREFETRLVAEGVAVDGASKQTIRVPAKSQAKVEWVLDAGKLPDSGNAVLRGEVVDAADATNPEYADALQVGVPIVPKGVEHRILAGGTVGREGSTVLELPGDRIEPATTVRFELNAGLRALMMARADEILRSGRYSSVSAANQLEAAALIGKPSTSREVREALAMLSRTQRPDGWGWWEESPADNVVTARIVSALGIAKANGLPIWERLLEAARASVVNRYNQTNLWEHRALLASAAVFAGEKKGYEEIDEVRERGQSLSPYARLRMADALAVGGSRKAALDLVEDVLKDASDGPNEAFIPAGYGVGWTASEAETTAEALAALARLDVRPQFQSKLARWLAGARVRYWCSDDEQSAIVRAIALYTNRHPDAQRLGNVEIEVGGRTIKATPSTVGNSVSAVIPRELLVSGENRISVRRDGDGEAFYSVQAKVFRPSEGESTHGIRVLRRFEVRNDAGVWVELDREVRPSEPVRVTAVAWGDDISDAVKVVEPIPAGFEMMEGESFQYGRQEVRDGAVIHYMLNSGAPQTFRYYLRAESEGRLTALPATAEYIRRPATRGESSQEKVEVRVKG